jgi:CheY-like chemotaxis protein
MNQDVSSYSSEQRSVDLVRLRNMQAVFIRNVHHELRTPLAVALGYTELLTQGMAGELNADQQEILVVMSQRLFDLQTIVERIGVLLEAESNSTVRVSLSPAEILAAVSTAQLAAAEKAQIQLSLISEPDLPPVFGDPKALAQALECLIENAIRFTPAGGQVTVRIHARPDEVQFEVADTGIGILPDQVAYILNGFYQVDQSDARRYNGLGLGLAIVKSVVHSHGGQLEVKSEPGKGSRFTLSLPSAATGVSAMNQLPETPSAAARRHRILLVDDEVNQLTVLKSGLAKLPNCEVTVATGGRQALGLFAQQTFDLIITDYRMPEMDGLTLANAVREQYPSTRIIMLTAFGNEVVSEQADNSPVQLVLEKPIDIRHIRSAALLALEQAAPGGDPKPAA